MRELQVKFVKLNVKIREKCDVLRTVSTFKLNLNIKNDCMELNSHWITICILKWGCFLSLQGCDTDRIQSEKIYVVDFDIHKTFQFFSSILSSHPFAKV